METEITPEQKGHLETWAGQRDAILLEISSLQSEKEQLELKNITLAESYTDIELRMNQNVGRIEELKKKEAELPLLISKEISSLNSEKSILQTEVTQLKSVLEVLKSDKEEVKADIASAISTFSVVKAESLLLEKIVDHVTKTSESNVKKIDSLVENLAKSLEEIIEVNKKNVAETNVVLDKLPRMLVEIQKRGLIKNKL